MIVQVRDCPEAYNKCLSHVLGLIPTTDNNKLLARTEQLFHEEFGIKIVVWETLEFKDQEHFLEWYLKWS